MHMQYCCSNSFHRLVGRKYHAGRRCVCVYAALVPRRSELLVSVSGDAARLRKDAAISQEKPREPPMKTSWSLLLPAACFRLLWLLYSLVGQAYSWFSASRWRSHGYLYGPDWWFSTPSPRGTSSTQRYKRHTSEELTGLITPQTAVMMTARV